MFVFQKYVCDNNEKTDLGIRLLSSSKLVISCHGCGSTHTHIGRARKRFVEGMQVPELGREYVTPLVVLAGPINQIETIRRCMKTTFRYLFIVLGCLASVHPAPVQTTNVTLSIANAGNQLVLFWPTTVMNYVLQSTTNLAATNWVNVSGAVSVTVVTVPNTSPASFFRLNLSTNPSVTSVAWRSFRRVRLLWGTRWTVKAMLTRLL
jgi:hypothetical protein